MKAKRFEAAIWEGVWTDGKRHQVVLATDHEAAISRKDEALRRCVEAMKKAEPVFVQSPSDIAEWDGIVAAAWAALEET